MSAQAREWVRRWRLWWHATQKANHGGHWPLDLRLATLTILNIGLIWLWHMLRVAYDAGIHHPWRVFGLIVLTLWTWLDLARTLMSRVKDMTRPPAKRSAD
jgi:hypothetical protein